MGKNLKPEFDHLECLKVNFGHTEFRSCQWDVIRSIIVEQRDNFCMMPTGCGKSLPVSISISEWNRICQYWLETIRGDVISLPIVFNV